MFLFPYLVTDKRGEPNNMVMWSLAAELLGLIIHIILILYYHERRLVSNSKAENLSGVSLDFRLDHPFEHCLCTYGHEARRCFPWSEYAA